MVPLLVNVAKLTQHQAHGTSLVAVVATGLSGAVAYGAGGNVVPEVAACITVSAMVFAGIGARATMALSGTQLKRAMGVFMLLVGPLIPLNGHLKRSSERLVENI